MSFKPRIHKTSLGAGTYCRRDLYNSGPTEGDTPKKLTKFENALGTLLTTTEPCHDCLYVS